MEPVDLVVGFVQLRSKQKSIPAQIIENIERLAKREIAVRSESI